VAPGEHEPAKFKVEQFLLRDFVRRIRSFIRAAFARSLTAISDLVLNLPKHVAPRSASSGERRDKGLSADKRSRMDWSMMRAGKIKSRGVDEGNDSNGNRVYERRGAGRLVMPADRSRVRRILAVQYLLGAHQSADPARRAVLLGMAQRWLDLANHEYGPADPNDFDAAINRQIIILVKLGRELQSQFKLPSELPAQMTALLMQLEQVCVGRQQADQEGRRPH
jgi:hypothetical protein